MARLKAKFRVGQVVAFVDVILFGRIKKIQQMPVPMGAGDEMGWYYMLEPDNGPYHESHLRSLTKREKGE